MHYGQGKLQPCPRHAGIAQGRVSCTAQLRALADKAQAKGLTAIGPPLNAGSLILFWNPSGRDFSISTATCGRNGFAATRLRDVCLTWLCEHAVQRHS
jgi:hypothetical protein